MRIEHEEFSAKFTDPYDNIGFTDEQLAEAMDKGII
jgi:hypothetical protein